MRILLTGAGGQVGYELARSLQPLGQVMAVDRSAMDLSDLGQVRDVIRSVKPGLIVNAAAYTAVDKAESEPQLARRVNAEAPEAMAVEARKLGAAMVHYSTDYVFDGSKSGAYVESDTPNPLNVYGQSKLDGEQAVAAAGIDHLILRTSWVYGMRGKNFLLTMLRLAKERDELRVVCDQHGAPTWSRTVADTSAVLLAKAQQGGRDWWAQHTGLYHLGSGGQTTWCGFTEEILALQKLNCKLVPITTADYPLPARRPQNSLLDCTRLRALCALPDWRDALALCLE
ncbi:dTDP-4-dehydrorhamnose reductase [Massilia sp. GCM10020059]|uniref:dTDP-4-dehydrorhamnose reductase n=1 Tax=Massilia agrisoli TaxID=2892444 RepID=A0ABS8IXU4_9BURK|nr:dTDP-4-dehydrorhamnose reductase [Massilia agrisoli]MCC6073364.1 dTDP-4-dehydrorhamnose reductase [Massilia agrisoli]